MGPPTTSGSDQTRGQDSPLTPGLGRAGVAVGSVFDGRYQLDALVGRGGMAAVYRGRDRVLDRAVALKVFHVPTVGGSEQRRIEAEVRTLAELRHPGLVTLYDGSLADDPLQPAYLVMEYVPGETLMDRLRRGPLNPGGVAALGARLADALAHVHARGIVHRDVKPANILLGEGGEQPAPKLTDFGIARMSDDTRITADGLTMGTANYLSPEQARGAFVTPASDIYALGLVLIECLTGRIAYPGSGIDAAIARMSRAPDIPQTFGPAWAALLSAMTAFDPQDRPSAAEAAASLDQFQDADAFGVGEAVGAASTGPIAPAAAQPAGQTSPLTTARRRCRRSAYVVAGAVAALTCALLLGLIGAFGSHNPTNGVPTDPSAHTQSPRPARHSQSTSFQRPPTVAAVVRPRPTATVKSIAAHRPTHSPSSRRSPAPQSTPAAPSTAAGSSSAGTPPSSAP